MSIFDTLAKEWDLNPRRVDSIKNLSKYINNILEIDDMVVADYGAGSGMLSFELSDKAKQVDAYDNSQGMLDEIQKKIVSTNAKNITPILHDITKENLPKAKYDLFITHMTLHHIEDTTLFIQRAKESLKKGGYLAISDLCEEDGTFHTRGNEGVHHFGFRTDKLVKLLEDEGFQTIFDDTIEVIQKDREYPIFLIVGKYD